MYQICLHCGKESRTIDRFCLHCGQRLAEVEQSSGEFGAVYVAPPERGGIWSISQPSEPANPSTPGAGGNENGAASRPSAETPASAAATPPIIGWLAFKPREGDTAGPREFALDGREMLIGRAPMCDVVLPDDQIASRRHSSLRFVSDHYVISDLGSSNGTYVNDVEIHSETPLTDGDRITVGEHELVYTLATLVEMGAFAQTTDGFRIPVPPPWPPAPSSDTDVRLPSAKAPSAEPEAESTPLPTDSATPPIALAVAASDLESLHAQLTEASSALAHRVEKVEGEIQRLRTALAAMAQQTDDALAAHALAIASSPPLDDVIQVVRQAAENPRHLDYITALAECADDVLRVLEHESGLASVLHDLSAQLAELAQEPER
jgi:pSer/pThr/pTyr-binding forkhead associated (FHA) protein